MDDQPESTEVLIDRLVERSVEHAVFGAWASSSSW